MSTTVDNRVVSLKFDNSGFSNKVSETRKQLENLNKDLSLDNVEKGSSRLQSFFDRFQNGIEKLTLDPIKNSVQSVQVEFSKFDAFVSGMFIRLGQDVMQFGEKFVKSLSVDNILAGYREYELKMDSMKVIMASNAKYSLGQVNKYLEELNTYADRTIYKFSDMTTAIGRFVSMGVDVETATKAIQGASSLTALTGGGNAENQRVMYNTSQALATGYMSMMDWRSMENARVSKQWYQQIMAVMKEMRDAGKLSEEASEFYVNAANNYGYFREHLKDKFVTKDIIVESLMRFSDETTALGKKALEAATEVTTFTKLIDTVKEGVGSGWARIFEDIIGNYEESKKLWTDLNAFLSNIFVEPLDGIHNFLKEWGNAFVRFETDSKDSTKRVAITAQQDLINAFRDIMEFITEALKNIKEAWSEVFGKTAVEYLVELTIKFKTWTEQLKNNTALIQRIKDVATSVFKVIKFIKNVIVAIGKVLTKVVWPVLKVIFKFVFSIASSIANVLGSLADGLSSFIGGLFGTSSHITKIQQVTEDMNSSIQDAADSIDDATSALDDYNSSLNATASATSKTTKATEKAAQELEAYRELFAAHGVDINSDAFDGIEDAIEWYKETLKAMGMSQATIDKYNEMVENTGRSFASSKGIFYPDASASDSILEKMFGNFISPDEIDKLWSKNYPKYNGNDKTILSNIEKAMKSGSFISGDYFYSYYGKAIPIDEIVKLAQQRDKALSLDSSASNIKKNSGTIKKSFNGILSSIDATTRTLKLFPILTSSKVQNGIKEIGKGTEKAIKGVSEISRGIARNSPLYKSFPGIQKATEKVFKTNDKIFNGTKKGIINFSKGLEKLVKRTIKIPKLNFGFGKKDVKNANSVAKSAGDAASNASKAASAAKSAKKDSDKIGDGSGISDGFAKSFREELESLESTPDKLKLVGKKAAEKVEEGLGKVVEKSFNGIMKLLGQSTESIDMSDMTTTQKIFAVTDKIKEVFQTNISKETRDEIKGIFTDLSEIFKNIIRVVKEVFSIFGMSLKSAKKGGKDVSKESKNIFDYFKMAVSKIKEVTGKIREVVESIHLIDRETGELTDRGKKVKKVIDTIIVVIKAIGTALLWPIALIKKIFEIIQKYRKGNSFSDIFKNAFGKFLDRLVEVKNKVFDFFKNMFNKVKGFVDNIKKVGVKQTFLNLFNSLTAKLKKFKDDIKTLGIKQAFKNLLGDAGSSNIGKSISNIKDKIVSFFKNIKELGLKKLLEKLPATFWTIFGRISYQLYSFKEKVLDLFETIKQRAKDFVENWKSGGFNFALTEMFNTSKLGGKFSTFFETVSSKFKNLGQRIKDYIENTPGENVWKDIANNKVIKFAISVGKFLFRIIGAGLKLAFDGLFKKFMNFVGLGDLITDENLETLSIWDKLKLIFENILNGSFTEAIGNTSIVGFIKWLAEAIWITIKEKFTAGKDKVLGWFGVNKKDSDKSGSYFATSSSSSSSSSQVDGVTTSVEKLGNAVKAIDEGKEPNWEKVMGFGSFTLIALKMLNILNTLAKSSALGNIASNFTTFIGSISKAFASFAAIATLATIIEFAAVVYILVKAMSYLAELDTETIKKNVEQLFVILGGLTEAIAEFAALSFSLNAISAGMNMKASAKGVSTGKSTNYFGSLAIMMLAISAGLAMLLKACAKLADTADMEKVSAIIDKVFGDGEHEFGIFGKVMDSLITLVLVAGILGILQSKAEANQKSSNSYGNGKFSPVIQIGTMSRTIKQSPLAGIADMMGQLAKILIIVMAGYVVLLAAMAYIMNSSKISNGEDVIKKATDALGMILWSMGALLVIIFLGLALLGKAAGGGDKAVPMLKQLGWFMAALGYALSSLFLTMSLFVLTISKDSINLAKLHNIEAIMGIVFGAILIMLGVVILGAKWLAPKVKEVEKTADDGTVSTIEEAGPDTITPLIKVIGDLLIGIIKPMKWLFAGIGLMMKLSKDMSIDQFYQVEVILQVIFGAIILLLIVVLAFASKFQKQSEGSEATTDIPGFIKSIALVIGILAAAILVIAGSLVGLMYAIKDIGGAESGEFEAASSAMLVIFLGIFVILGTVLLMMSQYSKSGVNFDELKDFMNSLSIFMGVIAAFMLVAAASFAILAYVIKDMNPDDFEKTKNIFTRILIALGVFFIIFAVAIGVLSKVGVKATDALGIAGAFLIAAASFIVIALALKMINEAFDEMDAAEDPDRWKKILTVLGIFMAIMLIIGVVGGVAGGMSGGVVTLGILELAGAFLAVGLAFLAVAAAIYILVKAFELFIDVIERFHAEKDKIEEGIDSLLELMPKIKKLISDLMASVIEGLAEGLVRSATALGKAFGDTLLSALTWVADNIDTILDAIDRIWDSIKEHLFKRIYDAFNLEEGGLFDGMFNGIRNSLKKAKQDAPGWAQGIFDILCTVFDVHSPSGFTEFIGKMLMKGLAEGIGNKQEQKGVGNALGGITDKISNAFSSSSLGDTGIFDNLGESIQGALDQNKFSIDVGAVLDMDSVTKSMSDLEGMNSLAGNLDPTSLMGNMDTSQFTAGSMADLASMGGTGNINGDIYNTTNYTQNNYSPEPIDSVEVYRQTNNQLKFGTSNANGYQDQNGRTYVHGPNSRVYVKGYNSAGRPILGYDKSKSYNYTEYKGEYK